MSHVRVNLGLLRSRPSGSHASSPARDSERVRSTRLQQSVALITLFSFSSMKRLKPPLWSTTTGERLSFLAIFHTHKHKDVEIDSVVTEFAPDGVTLTRQTPLSSRAYTFKISLYPPPENQFRKMSTTNNNVVMAHFSFSWLVESPCVCSYYRNSEPVLGNSFVILSDVYTHS